MNHFFIRVSFLIFAIFIAFGCKHNHQVINLGNGQINIDLSVNDKNIPYISQVKASDNSVIYFSDKSSGKVLQNRLSKSFIKGDVNIKPLSGWTITEDSVFFKAQASLDVNGCTFIMHVDLIKDLPIISIYNTVNSSKALEVIEFPILGVEMSLPDSSQSIHWWKAYDYVPQKETIGSDTHLSLNSRVHSADNLNNVQGYMPYWAIETPGSFMGFSIAWCGGWRASLCGQRGLLVSDIYLPEDETQLKLKPGEFVNGPEISIFCSPVSDYVIARKNWLNARTQHAGKLYPTPQIGIPFIYNHWYSVRFDLSSKFIKDQVKWFGQYGFDVFMIDAGWYKSAGSWTPSTEKFKQGEFENALQFIRSGGAISGLWSCPQFISTKEPFPDFIDKPGYNNIFMKSWIIDYNALDFNKYMVKHLDTLKSIGANWWKFDQEFFPLKPRAGKLRSVNAFQNGFATARKSQPDMIFEACMGGGKMINEFTDRISQIHWIRDGNRTGYVHALTNIHEALGAVDFLEPQKVQRWTNRIDETDIKSPDLLKLYCRSCMIGSWGISADLNKISEQQRLIILEEVKNYRKLNEIKKDKLIEFSYPNEYTTLVPVTFYNENFTRAAILLYSLSPNEKPAIFKIKTRLSPARDYEFYDADSKSTQVVHGNEFELSLSPAQNSAIFFINEVASN